MTFERLTLFVLVGVSAFILSMILWKEIGVPVRKWLWSFLTARYPRLGQKKTKHTTFVQSGVGRRGRQE